METRKTIIVINNFNEDDLPSMYDYLKQANEDASPSTLIQHSIIDFENNKVYNIEFILKSEIDNISNIVKSIEKWKEDADDNSGKIPLGNEEFIQPSPISYDKEDSFLIDTTIEPLNDFLDKLAIHCEPGCCGIMAYSFEADDIKKVSKDFDRTKLKLQINQVKQTILQRKESFLYSMRMNFGSDKIVFSKLFNHIEKNV